MTQLERVERLRAVLVEASQLAADGGGRLHSCVATAPESLLSAAEQIGGRRETIQYDGYEWDVVELGGGFRVTGLHRQLSAAPELEPGIKP